MPNLRPLIQEAIDKFGLSERRISLSHLANPKFENNEEPLPIGTQFKVIDDPYTYYIIFGVIAVPMGADKPPELNYLLKTSTCEYELKDPNSGCLLPQFIPHSVLMDCISTELDKPGVESEVVNSGEPESERIFD
jgi:hypothetical protein